MNTRTNPQPEHCIRWMHPAGLAGLILGFVLAGPMHAQDVSNYQIAESVAAYLGVMPAEIISGHPPNHPETRMHGGPSQVAHSEHIVVALFDDPSGNRIEDATVKATISGTGHIAITPMTLDPMLIAGVITYGGYITFPGADTYTIDLQISRPDSATVTRMRFAYAHGST